MRRLVYWLLMATGSLVLGLGSAWLAIASGESKVIVNGPWHENPLAGSTAAGLYNRARVAAAGPLALNRSEAVYWTAATDGQGLPLTRDHTYRLTGRKLDARWWSVTAYDEDGFLIANPGNRYSVNSENVRETADGRFEIRIGSRKLVGNWLPIAGSGSFYLTLRLYRPGTSLTRDPKHAPLPKLERVEAGA